MLRWYPVTHHPQLTSIFAIIVLYMVTSIGNTMTYLTFRVFILLLNR